MEIRTEPYLIFYLCFLIAHITVAYDVLVDDAGTECPRSRPPIFDAYEDTLTNHGATVHWTSEESWINLVYMDALMLLWHHTLRIFDSVLVPVTETQIIEFARNGGNVVIWTGGGESQSINYLLTNPAWQPTIEIGDTICGPYWLCFEQFPPFTDGVDSVCLATPPVISCGENAYPFAFDGPNSSCIYPHIAISYPFKHEGNCSSFIVVATGTEWDPLLLSAGDEIRLASNILLTAAGVPGYELEPGAIPGGGNACEQIPEDYRCSRFPNPFTPNNDDIYDIVNFEFAGMGHEEAVIKIFSLEGIKVREIEVPTGYSAKSAAVWDGTDNSGAQMPMGIYLYVIKSGGQIICNGTVTLAR